jgi:ATP-dependent helicase/nuclease subunit A
MALKSGPFKGKIIDPATEINLRESIINQVLQDAFESEDPATEKLLPVYGMPGLRDTLRSCVIKQELHHGFKTVSDGLPSLEPEEQSLLEAFLQLTDKVKSRMEDIKRGHHWLSFNDLEIRALENLRHPDLTLQNFLSPLTHLLVDEFQDTSPVQIGILEALQNFKSQKKQEFFLFAVGDPKQSIYRFRNVDRSLIEKTQEKVVKNGGQSFILSKNYRSVPAIVDFANLFSVGAFPQVTPSEPVRTGEAETGVRILPIELPETDSDRASRQSAEAGWVAQKILAYHGKGRPWETMAVLFRASASALPLIDHLRALGIPFTLRGGRDLFDRQEILDLKNLLFFLENPQENLFLIGAPLPSLSYFRRSIIFLNAGGPEGTKPFSIFIPAL